MTDHDELVEAGVKVLMEEGLDLYDAALDQFPHNVSLVIRAVEPMIRSDEQERHGNNCRGMWDEWLGDLREKVEALPHDESCQVDNVVIIDPEPECTCLRGDVLALLEEANDED